MSPLRRKIIKAYKEERNAILPHCIIWYLLNKGLKLKEVNVRYVCLNSLYFQQSGLKIENMPLVFTERVLLVLSIKREKDYFFFQNKSFHSDPEETD